MIKEIIEKTTLYTSKVLDELQTNILELTSLSIEDKGKVDIEFDKFRHKLRASYPLEEPVFLSNKIIEEGMQKLRYAFDFNNWALEMSKLELIEIHEKKLAEYISDVDMEFPATDLMLLFGKHFYQQFKMCEVIITSPHALAYFEEDRKKQYNLNCYIYDSRNHEVLRVINGCNIPLYE